MQRELQLGDHAEVPAATPQCPEQVRVLVFAGTHQFTFGGHHFGTQQVVACQSVHADEVSDAAAQREPANPVEETRPPVVARPRAWVSWSNRPPARSRLPILRTPGSGPPDCTHPGDQLGTTRPRG
jgi:hypothetical protein